MADLSDELEVIIVVNNDTKHRFVQDKKLLKKAGFKGGQDETCLLLGEDRLYVGADSLKSAHIRTAAAMAIKALKGTHTSHQSGNLHKQRMYLYTSCHGRRFYLGCVQL